MGVFCSNIDCDPCFRNPDINDFHLKDDSNCIDAGDPCANYEGETDIDGQCRVIYGKSDERADIGADEFAPKADYNGDSIVNFLDFAQFASAWKSTNNPSITLDDDNDVDIYDLALFCDDWLWIAPCSGLYQMLLEQQENSSMAMISQSADEPVVLVEQSPVTLVIEQPPVVEEPAVIAEPAEEEAGLTAEQIEENVEWLDQLWQSGGLEGWSEQEYLEFRIILQEMTY
ncbi:MAG: hypothetical protein ABII09_05570 [Planctomycetota bacterium]